MANSGKYIHDKRREIDSPWDVILERLELPFKTYEDGSPVDDYFAFDKMMDFVYNIADREEGWLIICEYKGRSFALILDFIYRPLLRWCVRQYGRGRRFPKNQKEIPVMITGYRPLKSKD